MRAVTFLVIPFALLLPLGGCAEQTGAVPRSQANTVQPVYFGTITDLQAVQISAGTTKIGAITGAIIGGAAGSVIGSSTGATVGGAAVGAAAGAAAGSTERRNGVSFTIRLDNGDNVAIVQRGDVRDFRVGQRVRVTGREDNARVSA